MPWAGARPHAHRAFSTMCGVQSPEPSVRAQLCERVEGRDRLRSVSAIASGSVNPRVCIPVYSPLQRQNFMFVRPKCAPGGHSAQAPSATLAPRPEPA